MRKAHRPRPGRDGRSRHERPLEDPQLVEFEVRDGREFQSRECPRAQLVQLVEKGHGGLFFGSSAGMAAIPMLKARPRSSDCARLVAGCTMSSASRSAWLERAAPRRKGGRSRRRAPKFSLDARRSRP